MNSSDPHRSMIHELATERNDHKQSSIFIPDLFPPLVVIVNRDGENFLGLFLSDDVTIQVFVDLFRRWRRFSFLLQLFPRRSALDSLLDSFLGIRLRQDDEKVMTLFAFDESEREI